MSVGFGAQRFAVGAITITTGTAVPSASEVDGSFYFRSGTPNGSVYVRTNGAWVLLSAASTPFGATDDGSAVGGGAAENLPAKPTGYVQVIIGSVRRWIAYYEDAPG